MSRTAAGLAQWHARAGPRAHDRPQPDDPLPSATDSKRIYKMRVYSVGASEASERTQRPLASRLVVSPTASPGSEPNPSHHQPDPTTPLSESPSLLAFLQVPVPRQAAWSALRGRGSLVTRRISPLGRLGLGLSPSLPARASAVFASSDCGGHGS